MANDIPDIKLPPSQSTDDDVRLKEYEALRSESDRSAQLLSNAVLTGVTGFGLTLAGAGAFCSSNNPSPLLVPTVALLLCVQALASSAVYASELWKYARVGTYIRVRIEGHFRTGNNSSPPLHWETWISDPKQRARSLHLASLFLLQAPFVLVFLASVLWYTAEAWIVASDSTVLRYLARDLWSDVLLDVFILLIFFVDALVMRYLGLRLLKAMKGDFGIGGIQAPAATNPSPL